MPPSNPAQILWQSLPVLEVCEFLTDMTAQLDCYPFLRMLIWAVVLLRNLADYLRVLFGQSVLLRHAALSQLSLCHRCRYV